MTKFRGFFFRAQIFRYSHIIAICIFVRPGDSKTTSTSMTKLQKHRWFLRLRLGWESKDPIPWHSPAHQWHRSMKHNIFPIFSYTLRLLTRLAYWKGRSESTSSCKPMPCIVWGRLERSEPTVMSTCNKCHGYPGPSQKLLTPPWKAAVTASSATWAERGIAGVFFNGRKSWWVRRCSLSHETIRLFP